MNNKQLDSYSVLITSKYLMKMNDFINLICVCKKFKETTEKLRFNPIPITSLKLFPKIQTQYVYDECDAIIEEIDNYEIWYKLDYNKYLECKIDNIKFHNVIYTHDNRLKYGDKIPNEINILGECCYGCKDIYLEDDSSNIKEIIIPTSIVSLSKFCFSNCDKLISIKLPTSLTSMGYGCFSDCWSLTSIILPPLLKTLKNWSFSDCSSLQSINLSSTLTSMGDGCFLGCEKLTSINLPTTLTSISYSCFSGCISLTLINLPSSIKEFGVSCFTGCDKLHGKVIVPEYCFNQI
ncbi:Leucine rich repeat protein bspa family [Entamoeba marina]